MARDYFSARRVLVTGGAGFVGSHLIDRLIEAGDEELGVDNLLTNVTKRNAYNSNSSERKHAGEEFAAVVHWPDIPVANSTERYYRKVEAISYGPGFEEEAEPNYSAN